MSTPIPIRNTWHMLLYAWEMASYCGKWDTDTEDAPSLLGLLARVLVDTTRPLLRRELGRAFVARSAEVPGVKGRINFATSLKRLSFQAGRAHCSFAVLDTDTPRNRILRWTLRRLSQDPRVSHVVAKDKARTLVHELHEAAALMDGVTLVRVTNASFRQLQAGRADRAYALPLAICALVQRLQLPTETAGNSAMTELLKDKITMPNLFERFVRNFWRHHLDDHKVEAETLSWGDELGSELVPSMRTDVVLTKTTTPQRRLVVDTKFYGETLSVHHDKASFKSENIYQVYAYLRTQEGTSDLHRNAEGMLLYPTTNGELDASMRVQGHRIRFATVDLAKPWQHVEGRLLELVNVAPDRVNRPDAWGRL